MLGIAALAYYPHLSIYGLDLAAVLGILVLLAVVVIFTQATVNSDRQWIGTHLDLVNVFAGVIALHGPALILVAWIDHGSLSDGSFLVLPWTPAALTGILAGSRLFLPSTPAQDLPTESTSD